MAAPKEKSLSLGPLTGSNKDAFSAIANQRQQRVKKKLVALRDDLSAQRHQHLRLMDLQQRWQELKDRENAARQQNKQLLQQFERAQESLRDMMDRTAAMKTIRTEYERYLEEISLCWQQQLREKTQAAQRKRMEYLKTCRKSTEEEQAAHSFLSQGSIKQPPSVAAPDAYPGRDGFHHLPCIHSSWLTQSPSQTAQLPASAPYQSQVSPQIPPSSIPHPHPLQLQHPAAVPGHHYHHWPRPSAPCWASPQPDYSYSWPSGAAGIPSGSEALWDPFYMSEPPPERESRRVVAEEMRRTPGSKRGSKEAHSSDELDVKPVRLSSGHAESSESGADSSRASGKKKKKKRKTRERPQHPSSERSNSRESSVTSNAVVIPSPTVARTSESVALSDKGSTSGRTTMRKIGGLAAESPIEKAVKEAARSEGGDREGRSQESRTSAEESGSGLEEPTSKNGVKQSPLKKSGKCRDESGIQAKESGSVSVRFENGAEDELEERESSSTEESSAGEAEEKDNEKEPSDGEEDDDDEEEPHSQREEKQEDSDDEVSAAGRTTEEDEETETEDETAEEESDEDQEDEEQSAKPRNESTENRGQASSQDDGVDEDEREESEDKVEEDEGSDEEEREGQRSDKAEEPEEERDSEDSIILPQKSRPPKFHATPEEASEDDKDEEGSKSGSSDEVEGEIGAEDIEHLLAPQVQTKTREDKDLKEETPKAVCDSVQIFQVDPNKPTGWALQSDSDEFDHFYD